MKREVYIYWLERRTNKTNLRREGKGGKSAKKKLQSQNTHFHNRPANLLKPNVH